MKGKGSRIFILTLCIMLIISLSVCTIACSKPTIYEDGFFRYIILEQSGPYSDKEEKDAVAIIGLTALGRQQEAIDFPEEIDGKPVRYIGYRDWSYYSEFYYSLESNNLKKVYIHKNIEHVYRDAFFGIADGESLEIMLCAPKDPYAIFDGQYHENKIYLYKSVYDPSIFNANINAANVVFTDNFSLVINDGYYRLDNIKSGEKITEPPPPDPERSKRNHDGGLYEFTGWYTEPESINAWDFDVAPNIEEGAEFVLYAGWRQS